MKKYLLTSLLCICCIVVSAQQKLSFSVLEFEQDVFDTSAKSTEHGKKDGNGSWYAIIKVTSNNPDDDITACQFNFGNMASKVEKHDEALWVYVQRNAKRVTISRNGYHTISQYDLQTTIEAGANYKMVLTSDRVQQQVVYDTKMQMVKFQTSPAVQGAIVTVTNESTGKKESIGVTASNGAISKGLGFGRYSYEVLAPDNLYYPSEGIVTLNSSDEVLTENVVLRPQFAEISLSVENDADIYINNEMKGKGKWNGKLSSGTYIVTCKKENHKDSQQRLVVEEGKAQNVVLSAPTPITCILIINTTPTDALVSIDGETKGITPVIIKDVVIGCRKISISRTGYQTEQLYRILEEGQQLNEDIELKKTDSSSQVCASQDFTIAEMKQKVKDCQNNRDYVEEAKLHQILANLGDRDSQRALGSLYWSSSGRYGITRDDKQSAYWYRMAAEQGDSLAMHNLAVHYAIGKGVSKDLAKAVYWYNKSAEAGYEGAELSLGYCYYEGKGVDQDFKEAVNWFTKAMVHNHSNSREAHFMLAECYFEGKGVKQDYNRALDLYKKVDVYDCFPSKLRWKAEMRLGDIYYYGYGVEKNKKIAKEYYEEAAKSIESAAEYFDEDTINEAKKKLKELKILK